MLKGEKITCIEDNKAELFPMKFFKRLKTCRKIKSGPILIKGQKVIF